MKSFGNCSNSDETRIILPWNDAVLDVHIIDVVLDVQIISSTELSVTVKKFLTSGSVLVSMLPLFITKGI